MKMDKNYDFRKIEKEILLFWRKNKKLIYGSFQESNKDKKQLFSWLEGPPTANAPPGLHHVEARVSKDLVCRYNFMRGFAVPRKGGWDCHGLPVEIQVQKKLKLKTKKDIYNFGVEKFINICKKDVFSFVREWSDMTERMGFWVDLDNPYITMEKNYMESEWWALKQLFDKGLIYKSYKVVPYSVGCESPLSSHEVALGYQDIIEDTVTIRIEAKEDIYKKFPELEKNIKLYYLVWTTTPWTLPSNLSIAVNDSINYVVVETDFSKNKKQKTYYVVAKDLLERYFPAKDGNRKVVKTIKGKELENLSYVPLFDYFKDKAVNSFKFILADFVTTEEGTGLVHQAPAFGEDDFNICREKGIDFVNPVDLEGKFTNEVPDYSGRFVKDCDTDIIKRLDKEGKLFVAYKVKHTYPFCWRTGKPLIYYAMNAWFISVSGFRNELVKNNNRINWYPESFKEGRFGNWISEAKDWALSRNKFWGTPLNIWVCNNEKCSYMEAIGSIAELKEKTGVEVDDLHIGSVDTLSYKCPKCNKTMKRTPEVIDCWFDSGAATFAQFHYPFENRDLFKKRFPYDFISESVDQTRGWFYTLHVLSTLLFNNLSYKDVAVTGLLCDEHGEKMSKSKGNILYPNDVFDKKGVDSVRLLMCSYPLGNNVKVGLSVFDEVIMPFFNILWNSYYYIADYINNSKLNNVKNINAKRAEDRWIVSRINSTINDVEKSMEKYDYAHATESIRNFVINDFSRTYIKVVRERTQEQDKELAFSFKYVFDRLIKIMAPFAPFVSEYVYQGFLKGSSWSVHFEKWPKHEKIDKRLEQEFSFASDIIQAILAAREKAQTGIRWPLSRAIIHQKEENPKRLSKDVESLVLSQTNIKRLEYTKRFGIEYGFKINYKNLGKAYGKKTADMIELINKNKNKVINAMANGKEKIAIDKNEVDLKEHLNMIKIVPKPFVLVSAKDFDVYLDTKMSSELENEGYFRELTRRVQSLRKKAELNKRDKIELVLELDKGFESFIRKNLKELEKKVGSKKTIFGKVSKEFRFSTKEKVKQKGFVIGIKKTA